MTTAATAKIILSIDKSKEQAFLEMLKLFDFVQVLTKEELLRRFIQNTLQPAPLSEADVLEEVMAHRYGVKK